MKITSDKVVFDINDNPSKDVMSAEVSAMLPDYYSGVNSSSILADIYSQKILDGYTVEDLSEIIIAVPDLIDSLTLTKIMMYRFGLQEEADGGFFNSLFYSLNETLDFNDKENIFYITQLHMKVSPLIAGGNIGSTVRHLYSLNRGRDDNGRVPVEEIRRFILLNKALRKEGIVLTATEVFYCSLNWGESDVFSLIEKGLSLNEALKMYDVGFKTVDEIVEYSGGVPMDWIDRILS